MAAATARRRHPRHSRLAAAALALAAAGVVVLAVDVAPALAQQEDQPAEQVANSPNNFAGVVNANAVYVHSGAGQNYYPVLKLDKGVEVKVVGIKFDWLKILPPDGTYSYVAKAFVERAGDGSTGRVTRPDLNVRAGSTLNDMKAIIQTRLDQDAVVEIVGEKDEYFMIKPPEGAYCYVHKQYVDPVKQIEPVADAAPPAGEAPAATAAPAGEQPKGTEGGATITTPDAPVANAGAAGEPMTDSTATEPSDATGEAMAGTADAGAAAAPATQPAEPAKVAADAEFDRLETEFDATSGKGLEEQPVDELLAAYRALVKEPGLPESMRRIADHRVRTLEVRAQAREQYLTALKAQQEAESRRMALQAEREELEQQIKATSVTMYTAVGTLQSSSLQLGVAEGQTLYRLTDPANGRTIVYVRTDDPGMAAFIGKFIGVKGALTTEPLLSMRVLTATEPTEVDKNALFRTVAAEVFPPSLIRPVEEASTDGGKPAGN